jgi:DNA polymerase I-like protein with 3'-5' exonuclease and polymerase domains
MNELIESTKSTMLKVNKGEELNKEYRNIIDRYRNKVKQFSIEIKKQVADILFVEKGISLASKFSRPSKELLENC